MAILACRSTPAQTYCATGSPRGRAPHAGQTMDGVGRRRPHRQLRASLHDFTGRFATLLRRRGLGRNDRVALLANNSIEHLLCYFGVMAAGATICTIHVEMNRNQLDNIFERLKPKLVLYQDGLQLDDLWRMRPRRGLRLGRCRTRRTPTRCLANLRAATPSEPETARVADDDAVILFTSGHQRQAERRGSEFSRISAQHRSGRRRLRHHGRRSPLRFPPFSWASAQLLGALAPVNRGATLVLAEKFSASRFFAHLRDHGVTIATGNPTTINILLNNEDQARIATTCRSYASSRRARRRCCSKNGSGSSRNSASRSRRATAPAK